jgi:hypothetical protein
MTNRVDGVRSVTKLAFAGRRQARRAGGPGRATDAPSLQRLAVAVPEVDTGAHPGSSMKEEEA